MTYNVKVGLLIPNMQSGGAERVISITSQLLSEKGFEVYLLLFDIENISYQYKGKLIDLKSKAGKTVISKLFKRITRIIKLSYYKCKYKLDFVISFLYSANVVNYYSIGSAKKVLSCRGYGDYVENGKKYAKMMKRIDSFIVQTERMKADFISHYNVNEAKISVINNPFDIPQIREKAQESIDYNHQKFIDTHKTICTVGSFKKDKGYWHLLRAFSLVKESISDAGLIFIGHGGEMETEIKKMAQTSKYKDDILFLDYQQNPFRFISKCKLYICSSLYEGFPNALVEAMACGTAVLSTDCKTGPRELMLKEDSKVERITDILYAEYGVLVPELEDTVDLDINNISSGEIQMADGIIKILSDEGLIQKYNVSAMNRADNFGMERYIENITNVIDKDFK